MHPYILQVSPRWILSPEGGEGLVGESLSLPCQARGVPTPQMTWKKAPGESGDQSIIDTYRDTLLQSNKE